MDSDQFQELMDCLRGIDEKLETMGEKLETMGEMVDRLETMEPNLYDLASALPTGIDSAYTLKDVVDAVRELELTVIRES
jgi:hypothetical protein